MSTDQTPAREPINPPDPMGEGRRTSGLVDAAPVAHDESGGVPPHPDADADFRLPATPPLPEFSVGIATYVLPSERHSRAYL